MYVRDTITAISTPNATGAIGIIRISGDSAVEILVKIFVAQNKNGDLSSHRFYLGSLVHPVSRIVIDEVMVVVMKSPNSYTREDIVEIHCHGSLLLMERVLEVIISLGARLAEPGEFTSRAFLNGRIDLLQAEAVMDIIASKSDQALALAQRQRAGLLSHMVVECCERLFSVLALIEAYIDFPDDDLGSLDIVKAVAKLSDVSTLVESLVSSYTEGRLIRDGMSILILGKPNVGKSSLLNLLVNENRSIVTDRPGTTRDIIDKSISINGLQVTFIDTAGIRRSEDLVEADGIERAVRMIPEADLILFIIDASRPIDDEDSEIIQLIGNARMLVVLNKCDIANVIELPEILLQKPAIKLSVRTGEGVDDLKQALYSTMNVSSVSQDINHIAISRVRHYEALKKGALYLDNARSGLTSGKELELISIDIRDSLDALKSLSGDVSRHDVLDQIFSTFCIGK